MSKKCGVTKVMVALNLQSEELKVAKESEAHVKRMKREMERQEVVHRKVRTSCVSALLIEIM